MQIKRLQFWKGAIFGDLSLFPFWSKKVWGEGDESLSKQSPMRKWKKTIILSPFGNPDTVFSPGFIDILGACKISSLTRKVEDGPFAMRMGPDDCWFFIASKKGMVYLDSIGYADIDDKSKNHLSLY